MSEYRKKLLEDFKKFHQVVGGAMELADRGWKSEVWCSEHYKEALEDLYYKYPIKYPIADNESFIPNTADDYLDIEDAIADYLEKEILKMLNG